MWLIVGLGNPGSRYALNRHNIGFMALDAFAKGAGSPPAKTEHDTTTCRFKMDDQDVLLAKPQTYMNKSGDSVQALMHFYKIEPTQMLVVHDDIDQPFGGIRFHQNRGAGGHNGIKSITERIGTQDYARLKLGVGRPTLPNQDVASFVLQNFNSDENVQLTPFLNVAGDAIESFIFDGISASASRFNKSHFTELL